MNKLLQNSKQDIDLITLLKEQAAIEYQKNQKRQDQHALKIMARETLFQEHLKQILANVTKSLNIPVCGYSKKKTNKNKKRILNLVLSDTHFHSLLDKKEVPTQFGPKEESRALASVVLETIDYKTQYRDETELYVHILGDLILGELHDLRAGANLTNQFGAVVYYLIQALTHLARTFPKVVVRFVPGNHGRRKIRHDKRATNEKWDSYETMIMFSVKMALVSIPNIEIIIPYTPYYTYTAFNRHGFATHGDTVINAGFPSSSININKLRSQINEWNAGSHKKCDLFIVGHLHTASMVHLPSGPIFMSNGCLIPPDPYAVSSGYFSTQNGQWMFESVENFIVGDTRFINVGKQQYNDSSLNALVKPYYGLDLKLNLT
jgi:hypothetical protein